MADSPSWADTAASLLSKLSGGVELNLAFDQVELQVPNPNGTAGTYRLNGSLRIRTKGEAAPAAPTLRIDAPATGSQPLG
ncbi:hypothetical protein [Hymenobacter nivis]|uniref:Uncharacterized protein n=1 Tax=Hymenobacter nivis TaxID=1850093 RepID=A0A502GP62_9BACT|nr:hypothetical protein [Hymenobacter nivis]TPG63681.1 hypothetical protein EAH73_16650 [Hymenobacter nivis]